MANVKFFKGDLTNYAKEYEAGGIYFDSASREIRLGNGGTGTAGYTAYGNGIKDAVLADSKLTISFHDTTKSDIVLDFSDIASASGTTIKFKELADKITALEDKVGDETKGLVKELADVKTGIDITVGELIGTEGTAGVTIYGAKKDAADAMAAAEAKISAVTSKTGDKYVKATTAGTAVTIESIGIDEAIGDAKTELIGTDEDAATADTIKGAKAAAKAADDKAAAAQTAADSKIKSVTGNTTVIAATDANHDVKVSLATSDKGNVKFTQDTDGLSANVTIPAATVTGVKTGDKVLALNGTELTSTISLSIDAAAGEDGKKYIRLKGIDGADLGKIDTADFVKDGMLDSASLATNPEGQPAGTYIVLTWNTDAGKQPMYINVTSLIDTYTAGDGLTLTDHEFAVDYTKVAKKSDLDAVKTYVDTAIADAALIWNDITA